MPQQNPIPTFVISLDRDADRRAAILAELAGQPNLAVSVISAVFGPSLPDLACFSLTRRDQWVKKKGAIGCFLSHVRAWELIVKLDAPFAVVLEDDAVAPKLGQIADLKVPEDADIIFINERMSPNPRRVGLPIVTPMLPTLRRLDANRSGAGTDGYLLTPAGARKLLDACADELYFGHIDGRLLRYATSVQDLAAVAPETWLGQVIRNHHGCDGPPPIAIVKGYCLAPHFVSHSTALPSVRDLFDED